jgi:hypothetical protein
MRWKFWNRSNETSEPSVAAAFAPATTGESPRHLESFAFPGSRSELVAMQRLVGNQTVLNMLAPAEISSTRRNSPVKNKSRRLAKFWLAGFSTRAQRNNS